MSNDTAILLCGWYGYLISRKEPTEEELDCLGELLEMAVDNSVLNDYFCFIDEWYYRTVFLVKKQEYPNKKDGIPGFLQDLLEKVKFCYRRLLQVQKLLLLTPLKIEIKIISNRV